MKKDIFIFNHFKEYASFCLLNNFEELYKDYFKRIKELNGTTLKLLSHLNENEIDGFFRERLEVFLNGVLNDCAFTEVELTVNNWKSGELPGNIDKYSIEPSDILMGFVARENALLGYLPNFTNDINTCLLITQELNVYNLLLQEKIFKVYIEINKEVINHKNSELNSTNLELQKQIIEKIQIEERLRREKDFCDAVINNSIDGVFAFDKELKITAWNRTLEDLNGLTRDKVIGKNIFELFPSYKNSEEGRIMYEVLEGKRINLGDRNYGNQRGFYEAYMLPLLNEKNEVTGGVSIIHDITHRKIAEEKISQRENLLKESQEIAHLGSWEWIIRNDKLIWSAEMYKIFGYRVEEVEVTTELVFAHVFQEDLQSVKIIIDESLKNISPFEFEVKIRGKDNHCRVLLVKGKILTYNNTVPYKMMGIAWDITDRKMTEEELKAKNIILEEKNEELKKIEFELLKTNNELEQRVDERTRQLSDTNNELNKEISERKKIAEALEQRNGELLKINDDLDNFVYTASHDLKSPISNIEGLVTTLNYECANASEEAKYIIEMINQSIYKFKETIDDLTEITKAQKNLEEDITLIDINKVLEEIQFSVKDMVTNSQANIVIYDGCNLPNIKFSKANLKSILYNLLTNAIKYRHPERNPEINICYEKQGEYILICVRDNGLGINENYKDKIFKMFKRLHDHVDGSGIGLYLVKRIVDNNGGKIEVESEEGKGSNFKIYLKV